MSTAKQSDSEAQAAPPELNKKVEAGRQGGLKRQALLRESKTGTVLCRHCDEPIYRPLDKCWTHVSGLGLKRCTAILEAEPDTRTTTTSGLAEALRGLSGRTNLKDFDRPECWCSAWDWTKHTDVCAAAREALAKHEGKA